MMMAHPTTMRMSSSRTTTSNEGAMVFLLLTLGWCSWILSTGWYGGKNKNNASIHSSKPFSCDAFSILSLSASSLSSLSKSLVVRQEQQRGRRIPTLLSAVDTTDSASDPDDPSATSLIRINNKNNNTNNNATGRRSFMSAVVGGTTSVAAMTTTETAEAAATAPTAPPFGIPPQLEGRNIAIGGGFDLLANERIAHKLHDTGDVLYPRSMAGVWQCDRVIKSIEGDTYQAKEAYRALGGTDSYFVENKIESYHTKYIPQVSKQGSEEDKTTIEEYVVNDRGYELASRLHINTETAGVTSTVTWTVAEPNTVEYLNNSKKTIQLRVTDRTVEPPSEQGFGFNELISIQDVSGSGSGPLASIGTLRAVQIKRRYRRALDTTTGARLVEGLEIMKTYRVLDGIAGIEYPTSTVKSQLTLSRPK